MATTSKLKELLKEYTAPLEDNYGTELYEENLDDLVQKIPEALLDDNKFIWRIGWQKDGKQVYTFFGSNNTQEQMEGACDKIAKAPWKRPVVLEAVVERRIWQ